MSPTAPRGESTTLPLEIASLVVSFGGNHVLTGVDLAIGPGFTGLIGPNGAGKTTVFNVVSGYVIASEGSVRVAGTNVIGRSQPAIARMGIGRTFQTPKLVADLSVLENVLIGMDGRSSLVDQMAQAFLPGRKAAANRARALAMLERFSLQDVAGVEAGSLPLGSQKIVEVCRALVAEPTLLLLDEPAAGLGRRDVELLIEPLRSLVRERDMAVVIIEHDLELVTNLCPDVAVLHLGMIIARGTPQECVRHPQVIEAYLGAGVAVDS